MTHFGILCPASTGHLNTMMPLGRELLHQGHQVTVFNFPDTKEKTLVSGLEFQALGKDEFPLGSMAEGFAQMEKLSRLEALRYTLNLVAQVSNLILSQAPAIIKKAGVDALLVDQVSLEGGTIADFLNIPFITVCSALLLNREPNIPPICTTWQYTPTWKGRLRNQVSYQLLSLLAKPIREAINGYRRQWNLPLYTHPNDYYSKLAQTSQQSAEF